MLLDRLVDELREQPLVGYHVNTRAASEPVAWIAMLMVAAGEIEAATTGAEWLARIQAEDGSVGIRERDPEPRWPTGLAVLTWLSLQQATGKRTQARQIDRGLRWIVANEGKTQERNPQTGHDTTLAAWSWADGTHSWVEPTAMHLLALRAAGLGESLRARIGVAMLIDRQLDSGGCNYGNTTVLGQELRPHLMPTAMALLALSGEPVHPKTRRSLEYLALGLQLECGSVSLAVGILALHAYAHSPPNAEQLLLKAHARVEQRDRSPYKKALLAHALLAEKSPVVNPAKSN